MNSAPVVVAGLLQLGDNVTQASAAPYRPRWIARRDRGNHRLQTGHQHRIRDASVFRPAPSLRTRPTGADMCTRTSDRPWHMFDRASPESGTSRSSRRVPAPGLPVRQSAYGFGRSVQAPYKSSVQAPAPVRSFCDATKQSRLPRIPPELFSATCEMSDSISTIASFISGRGPRLLSWYSPRLGR